MASSSGTKDDGGGGGGGGPPRSSSQRMTRAQTMMIDLPDGDGSAALDSEFVPSSMSEIVPILRVADEIEQNNRRVAYLCRFHALEKAHIKDPNSSGRGVRQFKTYLLHKLEKEEHETVRQLAGSDPREIQLYFQKFYVDNIKDGQHVKKPEEMAKLLQIASVLYDVLRTVVPHERIEAETEKYAQNVARLSKQPVHYNILPLYSAGIKPAIMELPEIKASLRAISNVENLPMPNLSYTHNSSFDFPNSGAKPVVDILDWVSSYFGFQNGNVANQREHLILLLANIDARNRSRGNYYELDRGTIDQLMDKIFRNYESWCHYVRCESNLKFPSGANRQQLQIIYIGLYLLIWGEASNIRFMPECICYIFHNMANEVHGILYSNVLPVSGVSYATPPPYDENFLRTVIAPIYEVIAKESRKCNSGTVSHSRWRNYDDLNEYFWSDKCFRLGWPMDRKGDFFVDSNDTPLTNQSSNRGSNVKTKPKTNFVEIRTFWHLYRSFDRMWIFFIVAFQAMVIFAWNASGSVADFFNEDVFRKVMSIFITWALLNFLQAALDIVLSLYTLRSLKASQILRYLLKFAVAAIWAVILPIGYSSSVQNPTGLVKFFNDRFMDWRSQSFYNCSVAIYLIPNMLSALLFVFPPLQRSMEKSNWRITTFIMWWAQPKLYVGRGMHEDILSLLKYTSFWIMLLISKLSFSYYVEILPLVGPTQRIMEMNFNDYLWQFLPNGTHNIGVVVAIWAPIVLVYFMDAQIWYAIFSTLFGGIHGAFSHLGEIRTLGMLRSRFTEVQPAFNELLVPLPSEDLRRQQQDESIQMNDSANFSRVWNTFIDSMREEDLINDEEKDLLRVPIPHSASDVSVPQLPPFLLASKIPIALDMAKDFRKKKDSELYKKMDKLMIYAVTESYETLRNIIYTLLEDDTDRNIVKNICYEVDLSIHQSRFLLNFKTSDLPLLSEKLEKFLKALLNEDEDVDAFKSKIINVLQDILEIIIQDVMVHGHDVLERAHPATVDAQNSKKEQRFGKINIGLTKNKSWKDKVARLLLLLTTKESAINVPSNYEARRRITFFANSLFMKLPHAPKVRDMLSFSVLTPYYKEQVLYSDEELKEQNEDGISTLFYLQTIYNDEWKYFEERTSKYTEKEMIEARRQWVSYRGQTLARTVRGMMYYRKALELQCSLEATGENENIEYSVQDQIPQTNDHSQALVDLKFTYVVTCQIYGKQKKSIVKKDRSCYLNILNLMSDYPSLRVAYIDEREEMVNGKSQKIFYSVLVKVVDKLEEEVYRIKLPGDPAAIGEGKPENQNHAIIFTRGEALQAIDMNQDNYFEEAFKMRNVLQEFLVPRNGPRKPTVLGLREHIFTGSVSSLAGFMSNQESSFVTIGQRILANPLRVRFHYGHPDIFERLFHITRGGISKASKTINLSEDIFGGFNSTLRGGYITHHEYIQVGKGRDVGLNQISAFEAKVANGNGEQTLTRDVYRLGMRFDFYRMLSFYFTTVGFYFSSMITVFIVYAFLYGRLYLVLSGLEKEIITRPSMHPNNGLEEALATQSFFQLGLLLVLPMIMEIGLEKGFRAALGEFIVMQLQLASVFFTFHLGTKSHYYGRTILHGGAKYRSTGRDFVVIHIKFAENYRTYSRSHFVKGLELVILLVLYQVFGASYRSSNLYLFITFSMWFLVGSWLFAPFVFNPSCFDWQKTVGDWADWKKWMGNRGGIGIPTEKSWESWWNQEQVHLKHTSIRGRALEIILACRFFIYQYGIVYHLKVFHNHRSILVFGVSWAVLIIVLLVLKMVSMGRRKFHIDLQLTFRILKALIFLAFLSVMSVLFIVWGLSIIDLFGAILAFTPTGWALLLITQACRPLFKKLKLYDSIKELARAYEYFMGVLIFAPIAILSWFPFVSEFQARLLFNQAFSRGLQISMILAGKKDETASKNGTNVKKNNSLTRS